MVGLWRWEIHAINPWDKLHRKVPQEIPDVLPLIHGFTGAYTMSNLQIPVNLLSEKKGRHFETWIRLLCPFPKFLATSLKMTSICDSLKASWFFRGYCK